MSQDSTLLIYTVWDPSGLRSEAGSDSASGLALFRLGATPVSLVHALFLGWQAAVHGVFIAMHGHFDVAH